MYSSLVPSVRSQACCMVSPSALPADPGAVIWLIGYQASPTPARFWIHWAQEAVGSAIPASTSAPLAPRKQSPDPGLPTYGPVAVPSAALAGAVLRGAALAWLSAVVAAAP